MFVYAQGAAYVEFDVHLSKDSVPIVYHDLTCCISTKKVPRKRACVYSLESQNCYFLYYLYSWFGYWLLHQHILLHVYYPIHNIPILTFLLYHFGFSYYVFVLKRTLILLVNKSTCLIRSFWEPHLTITGF